MKDNRSLMFAAAFALPMALMFIFACPGAAQWEVTKQFTPPPAAQAVTVYTAKRILTMEPGNPSATAVAVAGKRIVAVGSLNEVKSALGERIFTVNDTFQSKVLLPGLIDQHLHPFLGALTLSTEVIATEDWVLPGRTFKAAESQKEYRARLKAADAAMNGQERMAVLVGISPALAWKIGSKSP